MLLWAINHLKELKILQPGNALGSADGCFDSIASATSPENELRKICNAAKHRMLLTAANPGATFLDVHRAKETPAQSLDQRTRAEGFKRGHGQPSLASDG